MAGHWLQRKGCLDLRTDPKQSSFHLSFQLKCSSGETWKKDTKVQILQFYCPCNFLVWWQEAEEALKSLCAWHLQKSNF